MNPIIDFHMHTNIANTLEEEEAFVNMTEAASTGEAVSAMLHLEAFSNEREPQSICIYHANCADGFSAAWVFWKINQLYPILPPMTFHKGVYNEPPPDVEGKTVFLVDFSYPRQVIKDMIDLGGAQRVVVIDHHISAYKDLKGLDEELAEEWKIACAEMGDTDPDLDYDNPLELNFNMDKSGCILAWEYWADYFFQAGYDKPVLLDHIEDRDLWKFKLPLTESLATVVFSYEYTFENWDMLMNNDMVGLVGLAAGAQSLLRKHQKDVKELLAATETRCMIGAYDVPCANLPHIYASDAGHIMATRPENATLFAATYYDTATHRVFSLRSAKDTGMDVSKIAAKYGGGGHKNAAGFKISLQPRSTSEAQDMPEFIYPY